VQNLEKTKEQNQGQSSNDFKDRFFFKTKRMHGIVLFHVLIFEFQNVF